MTSQIQILVVTNPYGSIVVALLTQWKPKFSSSDLSKYVQVIITFAPLTSGRCRPVGRRRFPHKKCQKSCAEFCQKSCFRVALCVFIPSLVRGALSTQKSQTVSQHFWFASEPPIFFGSVPAAFIRVSSKTGLTPPPPQKKKKFIFFFWD